jgi:two-component system cell cycle response regulator DivK
MACELILIVEDNERNRKLVRDVLRFKGYQTIEVETGEETFAWLGTTARA